LSGVELGLDPLTTKNDDTEKVEATLSVNMEVCLCQLFYCYSVCNVMPVFI